MFSRSLRVRLKGFRRYNGSAGDICRQIISDCWNRRYFQASSGHFSEFYTRDFGWCTDSLLGLGHRNEVLNTLSYAMGIFSKAGAITTAISPSGRAFDFPSYAPDSLAFMLRSIDAAGAKCILQRHSGFINREIERFHERVIDPETGLARKSHFSSIKDHAVRQSSCYDNVMAAMLAGILKRHRCLDNPLKDYDFKKAIKENFWTGNYFLDDLSGCQSVTGDANLFPFWAGVFDSMGMMKRAFSSIREEGLDSPFPLKYSKRGIKQKFILSGRLLAGNYETDSIWMHMGPLYVKMLAKIDRERAESFRKKYAWLISRHGTFLELFDWSGKPYSTPFYYSDEGMLWAANFLALNSFGH